AAWRAWAVVLLGWFNVAAVVGWLLAGTTSLPVLAGLVLSTVAVWPLGRWALGMAKPVDAAADDLRLLEAVLVRLEAEPFAAPRLTELQASLTAEGVRPSEQV